MGTCRWTFHCSMAKECRVQQTLRSDRFFFSDLIHQVPSLVTERHVQRALLFAPHFLRTLLFAGHGGRGVMCSAGVVRYMCLMFVCGVSQWATYLQHGGRLPVRADIPPPPLDPPHPYSLVPGQNCQSGTFALAPRRPFWCPSSGDLRERRGYGAIPPTFGPRILGTPRVVKGIDVAMCLILLLAGLVAFVD